MFGETKKRTTEVTAVADLTKGIAERFTIIPAKVNTRIKESMVNMQC